ncbi:MAG: prepilin-type N-terminal cleavage/methylation domain-containing protein [Gammaproteobacteria bacterium]|nr:prepilin-type N-terminal cleavage/methylation domain-containing protein [Gammaproteobacteria bacterium]
MKKPIGFTLIEMVIVISIIAILSVMSAIPILRGYTAYNTSKTTMIADAQARYALERMARELRNLASKTAITTASAATITFVDSSGATVTYSLSGSQLLRNSDVLADNISSITFTYLDSTGSVTAVLANIRFITISLNVSISNATFTTSTAIYTRIPL